MTSKVNLMRVAVALISLWFVACATSRTGSGGASGVPVEAPKRDSSQSYRLPAFGEKKLANGMQILFVPDQSLPYLSFTLLVRTGAIHDPEGLSGLSSMVSEMIDKGTTKRTAPQIAADLGQIGADFDASTSSEYTLVTTSALSTKADALLANLYEIVTEPTFSEAEVERLRKQTLASIQRLEDNPGAFSGVAFRNYLFGAHPYAHSVPGRIKTVGNIKKKNIIQHYLRYYRPNNSILAVVGKFTPELAAKIEKDFGAWQMRAVPPTKFDPAPAIKGRQVMLVDKPGLVQAQVRFGHLGIARKSEDFVAVRLANTILGGAFASRLNNRVRRDLGLTYSIQSSFDARQEPGPFEIETFTKNESVGQTINETMQVLSEFRNKGPTSAEVDAARGYLKGLFAQAIETPEKLAMNLLLLRFYGVSDSYLTHYLSELDGLSTSDVTRVVKKYFDDQNIKVLVYSSASAVQGQLKALQSELVERKASEFQ